MSDYSLNKYKLKPYIQSVTKYYFQKKINKSALQKKTLTVKIQSASTLTNSIM